MQSVAPYDVALLSIFANSSVFYVLNEFEDSLVEVPIITLLHYIKKNKKTRARDLSLIRKSVFYSTNILTSCDFDEQHIGP